jgi:hypothetical protein
MDKTQFSRCIERKTLKKHNGKIVFFPFHKIEEIAIFVVILAIFVVIFMQLLLLIENRQRFVDGKRDNDFFNVFSFGVGKPL